jgi:hypothetical protein
MRSPYYGSKVARRLMTGRWGRVKDAHGINHRFTQGGGSFIAGPWIRPGAAETRREGGSTMHPMFYPFMLPTLFMLNMVSPYSRSSGPPHPVVWDTFASDLE